MTKIIELAEICRKSGMNFSTERMLSDYTTFKIGGKCSLMIDVSSVGEISEVLGYIRENGLKYAILGRGSNVIASDDGFDGVILHFGNGFSEISVDGCTITAQSGAMLSAVCKVAQENGLSGMAELYGIPGTVGGALYMNAGAYGGEMKDVVISAGYIDKNGNVCSVEKADMNLAYRRSVFSSSESVITSVTFGLEKGDPEEIKAAMNDFMERRISKQPLSYPSAGSTFKRPEGNYASRLIDECGLKGLSVGGAEVSTKHGGFVINKGGATCRDVLNLCSEVSRIVREKTGYELELEPVILK